MPSLFLIPVPLMPVVAVIPALISPLMLDNPPVFLRPGVVAPVPVAAHGHLNQRHGHMASTTRMPGWIIPSGGATGRPISTWRRTWAWA